MSFFDNLFYKVELLFTPKDGLYDTAADLIAKADSDGDRRVTLTDENDLGMPLFQGPLRLGFQAADRLGNNDGRVTIPEVRSFLQRYDVGSPIGHDTADNGELEPVEWLLLLKDLQNVGAPAQDASAGAAGAQPDQNTAQQAA